MRPTAWHATDDLDAFLVRAGDFLRSRPDLHTVPLTVTEVLRTRGPHAYGSGVPVLGLLEEGGSVRATYFRTPPHRLFLTPLTAERADSLAAHLQSLGQPVPGVSADARTAAAFAEAWRRRTGATPVPYRRQRLYRLGTLTAPRPLPEGRARIAGHGDRDLLVRWFGEFGRAVGESGGTPPESWADARLAYGGVTLWESSDGTPLAMAGLTPPVAGQIRVAPVYTPAPLRGRGYAGAVTAEVSRLARERGADEVLLFTDLANPTSNGLYQRLGYRPVADFTVYDFQGQSSS
ncbi:putative GNAT family acetyltransferase [Streptomyces sp. SAI-133]|uniref:GNAT family N-acetyltransferase n=1 Tax=unclassified Streptomyces TaxID=2593676 RepID=UPI002474DBBB|nr:MULTISPECIES: GNAT family N-acetyltransferase [unclassified Streptomyces]MDH6550596.1 putative GNAT family acetyltransferase [Streptomyces sp. SAI-041]MDH6585384.1 putative GNAT family acetyltransferase [Streptomyces sp. SAI-133]